VLLAVKLIGRSGNGLLTVVQGEYVNLHDFLLTEIAFANANKSGVLANMTVKEFRKHFIFSLVFVCMCSYHWFATFLTFSFFYFYLIHCNSVRMSYCIKRLLDFFDLHIVGQYFVSVGNI